VDISGRQTDCHIPLVSGNLKQHLLLDSLLIIVFRFDAKVLFVFSVFNYLLHLFNVCTAVCYCSFDNKFQMFSAQPIYFYASCIAVADGVEMNNVYTFSKGEHKFWAQ